MQKNYEYKLRWDVGLTEEAAVLVEKRRRRYVKDYASFTARGYAVVEELSPYSGHIITKGPDSRIHFVQELAARDVISSLIEEDQILGRRREYDWTCGTVMPSRRAISGGIITKSDHLRAFRKGITIFMRADNGPLSLESGVFIENRQSNEAMQTLPVRRIEPTYTRVVSDYD